MSHPDLPHSIPAPRALYLAGGEYMHVDSTEAALVVQNARGQILRYPMARIARVLSSPYVNWAGSALILCQHNGIPITWIDNRSEAIGTLFPSKARHLSLHHVLEVVLESEQGADDLPNWYLHRRMFVLQGWIESRSQNTPYSQWETIRREWVYREELSAHLPKAMRGLCSAYVASIMAQSGLQPHYHGPKAETIPLLQILVELVWAQLNLCTGALGDQAVDNEMQVHLMEGWQSKNSGVLLAHLHSLERWAIDQMHRN